MSKNRSANSAQYKPVSWPSVIPRIVVNDARALVDFLRATFNARGDYRTDRPTKLRIDNSLFLISKVGERQAAFRARSSHCRPMTTTHAACTLIFRGRSST